MNVVKSYRHKPKPLTAIIYVWRIVFYSSPPFKYYAGHINVIQVFYESCLPDLIWKLSPMTHLNANFLVYCAIVFLKPILLNNVQSVLTIMTELKVYLKLFLLHPVTIEQSDSLKAERDMYQALKARKEALEDALRKKTEELKMLCLQEGVSISVYLLSCLTCNNMICISYSPSPLPTHPTYIQTYTFCMRYH